MLDGKVVVVAGGAGTIGHALCRAIAEAGGVPVVADLDHGAAAEIASDLAALGHRAGAVVLDVTDASSVGSAIVSARVEWGRLDGFVFAAYPRTPGYGRPLPEISHADFAAFQAAHLGGCFLASRDFASTLAAAGGGAVVTLSSIYGVSAPDFSLYEGTSMTMPIEYAAAKAGIIAVTRYLAAHHLDDGVRCNVVAPGGVREDQPVAFQERYDARSGQRGLLEPEDLAGVVTFLLSDGARHVTGQVVVVDDGWSL